MDRTERELERDLGVEPVVDLPCTLRIHGSIVGVFVSPADLAEVLRLPEFRAWEVRHGATTFAAKPRQFIGYLHGMAVYVEDA